MTPKEDLEEILDNAKEIVLRNECLEEENQKSRSKLFEKENVSSQAELEIKDAFAVKTLVEQKLRDDYGDKINVMIFGTKLETRKSDGAKIWVVEGKAELRKRFLRKKKWKFTMALHANTKKLIFVRGKKSR